MNQSDGRPSAWRNVVLPPRPVNQDLRLGDLPCGAQGREPHSALVKENKLHACNESLNIPL
jgi:hypothetical protein